MDQNAPESPSADTERGPLQPNRLRWCASALAALMVFGALPGLAQVRAQESSAATVSSLSPLPDAIGPVSAFSAVREPEIPDAPEPSGWAHNAGVTPDQNGNAAPEQQTMQPGSVKSASQAAGSVYGQVTGADGSEYQGVEVRLNRLTPTASAAASESAISDGDGHFNFSNLAPGSYRLTVSANGFIPWTLDLKLGAGESFEAPPIVMRMASSISDVTVTASQFDIAQAQLKAEEQQRVLGILPNFYVVYAPNAAPLTPRQKFHLAWRSSIDPFSIIIAAGLAGQQQAQNDFKGYGQGARGYAKRFGANFADSFDSNMLGGALFPSIFKQDPRYFYKGTGTVRHRLFYAIANAVICKGDNGHWQFDYSAFIGGVAAGAIANTYYPASDREGVSLTIDETLIGIGTSAIGNIFQEFIVRRWTPKVPSYTTSTPGQSKN